MTSSTPARAADRTSSHALSWLVLFAALAVSLVSLLSADVAVRVAGLCVVGFGGIAACLLAWRSAERADQLARAQSLEDLRRSGATLHAERGSHREVLRVLGARNAELAKLVSQVASENATLRQQAATLRGNNESLRVELELLRTLESEAEVVTLPRRVSGTVDALSAAELWSESNSPTVVDLQAMAAPYVEETLRQLA